ncbi:MAG: arginine--tRNA ligase [Phycisphaeraceae bacterium]|nr:arginine--tRNA ligase [Phycisphaeraceae bacterium]
MSLQTQLDAALRQAIRSALDRDADPLLAPATNPKFGDYQANAAMGLSKAMGQKPRDLAEKIVAALAPGSGASALIAEATLAGPGFINLRLTDAALASAASDMLADDRLSVAPADPPQRIVIDYSGPNVAKEMHIGHLRSTIIGDALARTLDYLGHTVIRQNHLGDWGTQFGILIEFLVDMNWDADPKQLNHQVIADLDKFYRQAKQRFDSDGTFAAAARRRVVHLQSGDSRTLGLWKYLIKNSLLHFNTIYMRLGVLLNDGDIRSESSYNASLAGVVEALNHAGLLKVSDGARVVYPDGFKGKDGEPMPMIVRKSDGGYLYATTDLAAARYRIEQLHAQRVIYVTDSRQSQHFAMVFQVIKQLQWGDDVRFDHVPFGTILGPDRKPFKTRSGGTVKLSEVLDQAVQRASRVVADRDLDEKDKQRIAQVIGIGSVKYADLSNDRIKDYVFDYDRMLALEGNTAPYLINAYVRIQSIFRKVEESGIGCRVSGVGLKITDEAERSLVLKLLQFPGVVNAVAESLEPHRLCTYLYELAGGYHQFYERCQVLKADDAATRDSRLALCRLVARTLQKGLKLLGIETVDRM